MLSAPLDTSLASQSITNYLEYVMTISMVKVEKLLAKNAIPARNRVTLFICGRLTDRIHWF